MHNSSVASVPRRWHSAMTSMQNNQIILLLMAKQCIDPPKDGQAVHLTVALLPLGLSREILSRYHSSVEVVAMQHHKDQSKSSRECLHTKKIHILGMALSDHRAKSNRDAVE